MRLSLRQRVNFLQQVVPPTPDVMAEYERLDVGLDDATARIMGFNLLHLEGSAVAAELASAELVSLRARLPARCSGSGHRAMATIAPAAFVGSIAMVVPRLPDRYDDDGQLVVGLCAHLWPIVGTGADFQRKGEGSNRFATFLQQSALVQIQPGILFGESWDSLRRECGDVDEGVLSVPAADLPGTLVHAPPPDDRDGDVVFMRVQREVTRVREDLKFEALGARFALLPHNDPGRMAFKARPPSVALISLPSASLSLSPRELTSLLSVLFGVADPELLPHAGMPFRNGQWEATVDVYGRSLSNYIGKGTRRTTAHDVIVKRTASLLRHVSGERNIRCEDTSFFAGCIVDRRRRVQYLQDMGQRGSRRNASGIRPDILAHNWRTAISSVGPSKSQIFDIKTQGCSLTYGSNYHVRPTDARARQVPNEYLRLARAADSRWNGTAEGDVGSFERFLGSLPRVRAVVFGGYTEVSKSVDALCGEVATIGSEIPERFGCCHGADQAKGLVAQWFRRNLFREVARETVRCRHQALDLLLHRPSEAWAGSPDECNRMNGGPGEPGTGDAFAPSDNRAPFSGSSRGPARSA
jgi:hypothetical protein